MDNKKIIVDLNSINNTMHLMESKCGFLIDLINNYRKMFEDTKNYYDTNSGNLYREIVNDRLDTMEKYIKNDLISYIEQLNTITEIYNYEINGVINDIQGVKRL